MRLLLTPNHVNPVWRRLGRWLSPGAALVFAAGCAVGPDYEPVLGEAPAQETFAGADNALFASAELPSRWWRLYEEPLLDQFVEEALNANTDLRAAAANLARSQALFNESRSAWWPTTDVTLTSNTGRQSFMAGGEPISFEETVYQASFDIGYQVDLFGRIRRAVEAAEADADAALAALHVVQVTVAAETARAYVDACSAGFQLTVARESVALQEQSHDLIRRLQDAGRGTALDVATAAAQLERLRAEVPGLEARRQNALYRLAVLLGRAPRDYPAEAAQCTALPLIDNVIPVGDGADLLRRRPDVRQAERNLAAATARIGLAATEFYPSVSLGASAGSLALEPDDLGQGDNATWNFGPLLSWRFPNFTVARARVRQAEAGADAALARFEGTWLNALRETESALSDYANELDRRQALENARNHQDDAVTLATARYEAGQLNFLEVLRAELNLATAELALAGSRARAAELQVALFLALGGGWGE